MKRHVIYRVCGMHGQGKMFFFSHGREILYLDFAQWFMQLQYVMVVKGNWVSKGHVFIGYAQYYDVTLFYDVTKFDSIFQYSSYSFS